MRRRAASLLILATAVSMLTMVGGGLTLLGDVPASAGVAFSGQSVAEVTTRMNALPYNPEYQPEGEDRSFGPRSRPREHLGQRREPAQRRHTARTELRLERVRRPPGWGAMGDITSLVRITAVRGPGLEPIVFGHEVPARSRVTVRIADMVPPETDVSVTVEVVAGSAVVAERPEYFSRDFGFGVVDGGHVTLGAS